MISLKRQLSLATVDHSDPTAEVLGSCIRSTKMVLAGDFFGSDFDSNLLPRRGLALLFSQLSNWIQTDEMNNIRLSQ